MEPKERKQKCACVLTISAPEYQTDYVLMTVDTSNKKLVTKLIQHSYESKEQGEAILLDIENMHIGTDEEAKEKGCKTLVELKVPFLKKFLTNMVAKVKEKQIGFSPSDPIIDRVMLADLYPSKEACPPNANELIKVSIGVYYT